MLRSLMDETDEAVAASESFELPTPADEADSDGARPEPTAPASAAAIVVPDASIFRAYDIRGVVGETLNEDVAEAIGRAIGSEAHDRQLTRIAVARDGRLSGARMLAALSRGLMSTGLDVVDVGAVPTPVLYFAAQDIGGGSGVMVTGSHNPPDYNGFKIVLGGETLAGDAIAALHARLQEGRLVNGEGQTHEARINNQYIERIATDIQLEKPLKVVADCGNGIAGAIAPRLLEAIGADVIPLYAEVDGSFPNHHPDPGDPATLEDLRLCVRNFEADVGVAFDGDGDRLGVVGPNGEIIYPDRLMMLFAHDVLSRVPGGEIIYDVKCSSLLAGEIEAAGGRPVMGRTGHSFIKAELKKRQAPLAGEMSGHFFFAERWLGFDDGLYSAARLLEILAADTRAPGQVFGELPKAESTPEIKVPMKEGEPHAFVKAFQDKARFDDAEVNTIDGLRADFEDGFGLVRASNTTPVLVLRFEGTTKESLARIQGQFRDAMLAIHSSLKLPF
ncbi:phosphomannomutase/phosphoglucomutase [Wenzhouxiangella sp. XN79A]|nr:phosphomannomutase/phosphoglucomutase [Wenzhouxiangella sp. XN79A]